MYNYEYDFSIIMGYYNRKKQVINTLNYFKENYKKYNFEVIIVDDNSTSEHNLNDIINNYEYNINYITIDKKEKGDRINPSVPYNIGFKNAKGKKVIIQNPECIHVGDLLKTLNDNLTYNNYIAFSCYNCISDELTNELLENTSLINNIDFHNKNKQNNNFIWYNHPRYRPVHFHFCAAIMNDNLKILGGFNEEFAKGHSYDDNELLLSIEKNLKLDIISLYPNNGFVIHQWHSRDAENTISDKKIKNLYERNSMNNSLQYKVSLNRNLYNMYFLEHNKYNYKYPKLLHLYWDKSNLSFLNLLTVLSFNKYHIGWKINIYCPLNLNKNKSWSINEEKKEYNGKDYFNELKNISNVNIHEIDINNLSFKHKDASEVIKSDYFKLFILNKYGGLWSDFDIIYTNNIENYYSTKNISTEKNMILYRYLCKEENKFVYPVGLFLSNKENSILKEILNSINIFYNKNNYQCLGTNMFENIFHNKIFKDIISKMKLKEMLIDDANIYLPFKCNELDKFYKNKHKEIISYSKTKDIIGLKWFNEVDISKDYCNNLDLNKLKINEPNCLIDKLVKQYL